MKISFLLLFILFSLNFVNAQRYVKQSSLKTDFVLKKNREQYKNNLLKEISRFDNSKPGKNNKSAWIANFKKISLNVVTNPGVYSQLNRAFEYFPKSSRKFGRALLETAKSVYPDSFLTNVKQIYSTTKDEMVFGYCSLWLLEKDKNYRSPKEYLVDLENRFKNSKSSLLNLLRYDLKNYGDKYASLVPPVKDLLNNDFQKGKTIVYSFQRRNRNYPGRTVIKGPDGKFVTNDDSTLFSIPHLAVSVSGFPGYLKGGNTPQGIFSIVGWYLTPTKEIGPTPILLTRIPFEKSPKTFFHGKNKYSSWNIEDYRNILPESWKHYSPIFNAYYCGNLGRGLIVAHGSTDDLSFYKDKPYYPLTPTKGCLSAKEIWSEKDGSLIESDQLKMMNAYFSTNQSKGFLIVVDIDNKNEPITENEIQNIINTLHN